MTETVFWNRLSEAAFGGAADAPDIRHDGRLPGPLPVTALLAESAGLAGVALARLRGTPAGRVGVDGRLASLWASTSCRPVGWKPKELWNPLSAMFEGADGWIRLHANKSHHRAAALRVLGCGESKEAVAEAVSRRSVGDLEAAIVAEGGAAAMMYTPEEWRAHPQGRAVAESPLVEWTGRGGKAPERLRRRDYASARPLEGVRVLDLTRVLAGPVATRTLAGFGAEVLRIDPPFWEDDGILQDTTLGKRCAGLDLREPDGRDRLEALLGEADVLVHGYRPGALEGLGFDAAAMDRINPGRVDVSISAYGWTGPWAGRRGFDSLVQLSSGIAHLCRGGDGAPGALPVQALDHSSGYVMAACALEGLLRAREGGAFSARISLARVAALLCGAADADQPEGELASPEEGDFTEGVEGSDWGDLRRLHPSLSVPDAPMRWDFPSGELRRHPPEWPDGAGRAAR